jgi:hypothetical protein
VGSVRKVIRAHGERVVERRGGRLAFSPPQAFERLPLTYRRAYGGRDREAEARREALATGLEDVLSYARNPIGRGFLVGAGEERLLGSLAPNFEDPADPVTVGRLVREDADDWLDAPVAAGLGPIDPFTFPRAALLFPMAHRPPRRRVVEVERGDLRPGDLAERMPLGRATDERAFSCGSSGLRNLALRGDEVVSLEHLSPAAAYVTTRLPGARVTLTIQPPGCGARQVEAPLRMVELAPDRDSMVLTYAGAMAVAALYPADVLERVTTEVRWS